MHGDKRVVGRKPDRHFAERGPQPLDEMRTYRVALGRVVGTMSVAMDRIRVMHSLQRSAGNEAVCALLRSAADLNTRNALQRQASVAETSPDPEDFSNILNRAEVASAINFYRSQPHYYTRKIINQIRDVVGLPTNGIVDEPFVQKVAEQQVKVSGEPPLVPDGKAGPRTLPRLFPHGLKEPALTKDYATETKPLVKDWQAAGTPEDRLKRMTESANSQLAKSGVPVVNSILTDQASADAEFRAATWQVDVHPALCAEKPHGAQPSPTSEVDIGDSSSPTEVVALFYHEVRHAEQWFQMARMLAGEGWSEDKIAKTLVGADGGPMNQAAVKAAKNTAIRPDTMEALIARGWFDSEYGKHARRTKNVRDERIRAASAYKRAVEARRADASEANIKAEEKAKEHYLLTLEAYKDLPTENDATDTAKNVEIELTLLLILDQGTSPP